MYFPEDFEEGSDDDELSDDMNDPQMAEDDSEDEEDEEEEDEEEEVCLKNLTEKKLITSLLEVLVSIPGQVKTTQCRQLLATVAMFGAVLPKKLSCGKGSQFSSHASA